MHELKTDHCEDDVHRSWLILLINDIYKALFQILPSGASRNSIARAPLKPGYIGLNCPSVAGMALFSQPIQWFPVYLNIFSFKCTDIGSDCIAHKSRIVEIGFERKPDVDQIFLYRMLRRNLSFKNVC